MNVLLSNYLFRLLQIMFSKTATKNIVKYIVIVLFVLYWSYSSFVATIIFVLLRVAFYFEGDDSNNAGLINFLDKKYSNN